MSFPKYPKYKDSGVEWLGDVPEHWGTSRLSFEAEIRAGYPFNASLFGFEGTPVVRMSDFGNGRVDLENVKRVREEYVPDGALAEAGDVLLGLSGSITNFAIVDESDLPVAINQRVAVVRMSGMSRKTVLWFLQSPEFLNQLIADLPSTTILNISMGDLCKCRIPVPLPAEQTAIAAFLDAETAKIDELVAEQRRLIELLKEKRQAVISHAVTKGLNPNAPMKPSGIEWLGDVPEHWGIVSLGRVCNQVGDGPHFSPKYVEADNGGVLFLSARNIKVDRWDFDDVKYVSTTDAEEFDRCVRPEIGDVLYTKGGTTGIARVVDLSMRFQVWVHVAVLKIKKEIAAPEYIALALNSTGSYEQSQLYTRGATNQDLGLTRMVKIRICLPPIGEQLAIVSRLGFETRQFNTLLLEAERAIELLQERRTALISAAVTGKIDVRSFAPQIPEVA